MQALCISYSECFYLKTKGSSAYLSIAGGKETRLFGLGEYITQSQEVRGSCVLLTAKKEGRKTRGHRVRKMGAVNSEAEGR